MLTPPIFFPKSKISILYQTIFVITIFFILHNLIMIASMPFLFTIANDLNINTVLRNRLIEIITFLLSGFTISLFIKDKKATFKICFYLWIMIGLINLILYMCFKSNQFIVAIIEKDLGFLEFF